MTVIFARGNVRWPEEHDPSDKKFYRLNYRPVDWSANVERKQNVSIVKPTVANGCVYVCTSGGKSGATEPTWATLEGYTTTDGDVEWTCYADTCLLQNGDVISASVWTGDTGCTLDNDSIVSGIETKVRLTAVPAGATEVTLTNHITITRSNGDPEDRYRSIHIPITAQ